MKKGVLFFMWDFQSIISLQGLKLALNKSMRAPEDEQGIYNCDLTLRILTGKQHRQMKLQHLQKVQISAFGLLVQKINSL